MTSRIEDYGIVGDLQTAALIGRDGAVDWMCLPQFDSPACFAALLGDEQHGSWRLGPESGGECTSRRYRDGTLILETEWDLPEGRVRVIDLMPPRGDQADLVRIVEGISGNVPMSTELRLRFDYGHVVPWVTQERGGLRAVAGPDSVHIDAGVALTHGVADGAVHRAHFTVGPGDRVPFVLTHHASHLPIKPPVEAEAALRETEEFWRSWIAKSTYDGPWADAVHRSLITLKALTYAPTGAIAAAATTSLPEEIGGSRNWDYRFCWLRDAAFTLQALVGTGFIDEARAWRAWLLRAVAGDPADLQIMYGLDGRRRLPEYTLDWLPGYEDSGPVRIGNGAAGQLQIDVWGETLDALHLAREAGLESDEEAWALQKALLDYLEEHWDDLDNGLWEVRGPRRAFVHSRVMAWAGFDRAVRAVEEGGLDGPVERWRAVRDRIHADVCMHGFDAERNTFTQFYGSEGLDAALLLIGQVGFLPWDDPRVVGTVDAVQRELSQDGLLLRYHTDADDRVDGLPGEEATFLVCSFWLVDALHGIGRVDEAVALFERLLSLRNDLGLLSEEYDVHTGRHLGNTPQAFSHLGLVNSALRLAQGVTVRDVESGVESGVTERIAVPAAAPPSAPPAAGEIA
ncbi:Glucoamylase (glucan-1,4-alpha-glucosidase), GH15 family [Promicromonospora umidemergens]|uniref:Glycoside hydrolase family 15 protein n=1 Tax=Promicromonospora umidemergens TaxID=629679 RepID=A0ABP8XZK3_9MICO|nr:glycoside hydrolase family 15 protein [Promicromonospora umidemergens]MCP2284291.1 Glucoamylase (glucan-1,4-alpha-glucosidase), GH15 family [Promicromonospora umidemergens]